MTERNEKQIRFPVQIQADNEPNLFIVYNNENSTDPLDQF